MNTNLKTSYLALILLALLFLPARNSHAYLDPGSGSYMLQLIIAGIAGFLFSIKMFWRHIKNFFISFFYKAKLNKSVEKENDNE